MSVNISLDDISKAKIVHMILNRNTEEALQKLSKFYNVTPPEIVVGTIKGKRRTVYAVYVQKERRIYVINSDVFYNPFIVLHEFYHHIRTRVGVHRGSEKHANMYAKSFIDSYKKIVEKKMMMTMKPSSEK
jgi:competence CoiA-like predicted nuclease